MFYVVFVFVSEMELFAEMCSRLCLSCVCWPATDTDTRH